MWSLWRRECKCGGENEHMVKEVVVVRGMEVKSSAKRVTMENMTIMVRVV